LDFEIWSLENIARNKAIANNKVKGINKRIFDIKAFELHLTFEFLILSFKKWVLHHESFGGQR